MVLSPAGTSCPSAPETAGAGSGAEEGRGGDYAGVNVALELNFTGLDA